jgi:hypothetical protein
MGFDTDAGRGSIDADPAAAAKALSAVSALHRAAPQAIATMPDHRALIDQIHN